MHYYTLYLNSQEKSRHSEQKAIDNVGNKNYNDGIQNNEKRGEKVSEEKRCLIVEIVKNLRQLDKASLLIMKSGSEMLKARDALDDKVEEPVAV